MAKKHAKAEAAAEVVALDYIAERLRPLAVPVADLAENPDNAKRHDARSVETIAASLSRFGQRAPLVARRDGVVLAGNGRLMSARGLGWTHVAVLFVDDEGAAAEAFALLDNRSAEVGSEWDWEALAAALHRQVAAGQDLALIGWMEHEADPLLEAEFNASATAAKLNPDGTTHLAHVRPVIVTAEQREVFERAVARLRDREADPHMTEGRALELLCAEYLS